VAKADNSDFLQGRFCNDAICLLPVDFHGACVVNAHGEETPITEQMVRQACNRFDREWKAQYNLAYTVSQRASVKTPSHY
jgi:hypothetical protein